MGLGGGEGCITVCAFWFCVFCVYCFIAFCFYSLVLFFFIPSQ